VAKNKDQGTRFENRVLAALTEMIEKSYGSWGRGIRRREARGGTQDCDLIVGTSLGGMVVECKSKRVDRGVDPACSGAKFYLNQAISPSETTRLVDMAMGFGFAPVFAFEVIHNGSRGENGREGYLVHGEAVLAHLLEYRGITLDTLRRTGSPLAWVKCEGGFGYRTSAGQVADLLAAYREAVAGDLEGTALYEWCIRALDGRRGRYATPEEVPNIRRMIERVRNRNNALGWVRGNV